MEHKLNDGTVIHYSEVDVSPAVLSSWHPIKVYKVVSPDGDTHEDDSQWWVVRDGSWSPICVCPTELNAKIVATALEVCEDMRKRTKDAFKELGDKLKGELSENWDTERMDKDIHKLLDEGKTEEEVFKIMKERKDEYRKRKPTATTDDFKIPEGW